MLALTIVGLLGFLALAIDIGMLAVAKTQAQNAADVASLTAARTLNGDSTITFNNAAATNNAQAVLSYNTILGTKVQTSQLTLTYGSFDYNQTSQTFSSNFPPLSTSAWTVVSATITASNLPGAFSRIFGWQFLPTVTATSIAAHRPRDVALVMDLSTSMRFGTCLGFDFYTQTRTTNNPDPLVPAFGHYSSTSAVMTGPTTTRTSAVDSYSISPSNTTVGNSVYSLTYINSFYQNAPYASTLIRAFDSYTSTDGGATWSPPTTQTPQLPPTTYATTPGGDGPLYSSGSTTTYAQNVNQVLGTTGSPGPINPLWCLDGYAGYVNGKPDTSGTGGNPVVWTQPDYGSTPFAGFTKGPGYYGKTFFIWPPDPRTNATLSGTTLTAYLNMIGVTNTTDQSTLAANWATWQALGPTAGLTALQAWLSGITTLGGPYTTTAGPWVPGSNSKAPVYYAVCRLFNRAYPAGGSTVGSSKVPNTAPGAGTSFSADWRMRFFGTSNNTTLFNSSGSLNPPGSSGMMSAVSTYNAILTWLTTTSDPFPQQMRSGRIMYYSQIPTSITGSWPSWGGTDQRFWVEFMDHVLGFRQTGAGSYTDLTGINSSRQMIGYGADFAWGTVSLTAPPAVPQYMNYNDNPARGLLRFWFSPILMVDMLQNCNITQTGVSGAFFMQPGNAYEAPCYTGKQGFVGAVNTMKSNHPNDWFTLLSYSWPRTSPTSQGRLNCVNAPLGLNYSYATSAILFPFSTINADGTPNNTEITPYDPDPATGQIPSANFAFAPRADGDTCFAMGLMLAYNQFALTPVTDSTLRGFVTNSPITFPTGMAGGMGRKGAQKVVIFETDGMANCGATANLVTNGTYTYYQIRYDMNKPSTSEYPSTNPAGINNSTILNQVYSLVQQMATTYSTSRNPFRLYALGFGPVFTGPDAPSALSTLQTMQFYAGTQSSASTPLPAYQVITGTDVQMAQNMTNAYTLILQAGVQIALIQ
jgi:Flp pilus assembly protein TadG